ncbi:MAG: MFS transporter [Candidatus Omnitrophica bacterium]|nr:MFS transporter [Candidatus Omnitrophota bacterium]MBU1869087.1 MFS transporter [Candidatus Omnitrophota bacterium]
MRKSTFIILCLQGAILSFNVAAAAALIPSIANDLVLSQFYVGRIIWLYMIPYGLAALLYGPLVRAVDARDLEIFCMLFFSFANLLIAYSKFIYPVFVGRFLMGLFGASIIPLALILIAKHVEAKHRGRFVGIFFASTFVASLLGLFLSGIVNWRLIFIIPGVVGFASCMPLFFEMPSFKKELTGFKISYLAAFKDKRIISIFSYIFFISIFYHGVQQWLGVYFSHRSLNQFVISMLITLTSFSGIFGEVAGGWLSDKLGRVKTVDLGIIFMVISVVFLLFKLPVLILALIMVAWGFGWTLNHAGLSTMLTDLPQEFLNEAASLNSGIRFIAGGLGAVLGGLLMQKSFNFGFIVFGACLILLGFSAKKILVAKS